MPTPYRYQYMIPNFLKDMEDLYPYLDPLPWNLVNWKLQIVVEFEFELHMEQWQKPKSVDDII